jgi:hypothetical protein
MRICTHCLAVVTGLSQVVLGWVEGMADKVTGLQGAQHRMAQQVQSQREEQQFALNATARESEKLGDIECENVCFTLTAHFAFLLLPFP